MTSVERTSLERLDNSTSSFSLPEDIDVSQEYSDAPKSGRPVFGVFENCPVPNPSGYRTMSDNRTVMSGYWTFGLLTLQASSYRTFDSTSDNRT